MNIYFRHAALTKIALIASLLFVAAFFALAERVIVNLDDHVDPYNVPYSNSLFTNPYLPGFLGEEGTSRERARRMIVP